jgi:hypothetical protein
MTDMCRTYGAQNSFAIVPSPYVLGYVLSRLRRFGFVVVDLESSRGNSRLVIINSRLGVSDL